MAVEIPKTHKALVYDNPGTISTKIEELPTPEPGPGQVLIHLTHSGVCHSDMGVMMNSWAILPAPTPAGQVGGHEGVGTVVALGAGAESAGIAVGERVGVKWMSGVCGACHACLRGHDGVCAKGQISGYFTPGTFQQYVLGPANYVTKIPDGLDSAAAAPMLCSGVTVYSALRKCGALSGEWVVIMGAGGGLGHLAVQFSSRAIGHRVIGVDHSSKKQLALDSGAEHFFGIDTEKDIVEAIKAATGGLGASACVVVTANNKAYEQGIDVLGVGGTLVCVGVPEGNLVPIAHAFPGLILAKELSIRGVAVGDRRLADEALAFAARGVVKVHYKLAKMEELNKIFEDMDKGQLQGRMVLDLS